MKNPHLLELLGWGEAILTTYYLINHISRHVLGNVSPIKFMLSCFTSISKLQNVESHVFDFVVFVHIYKQYRNKLDPRVVIYIFLSYASNKRGFNWYHSFSRKVFVSKYVMFHENVPYFMCLNIMRRP